MTEKKDLQSRSEPNVEQTRPGPTFSPAVDISETEEAITVLADMPGVGPDDLTIDLRESVLTLTGVAASPEGDRETEVLREYDSGTFYRRFSLAESIDQSRIEASLKDGVLRLVLPKVQAAQPRRIAIKTG